MCKSLKNQWYSHQLCSCFIIVISNIGFSYQKQKTFKGKPWFSSRTWAPIMVVSSTKPFFCCYKWGYNSMGWLTSTYWLITVFFRAIYPYLKLKPEVVACEVVQVQVHQRSKRRQGRRLARVPTALRTETLWDDGLGTWLRLLPTECLGPKKTRDARGPGGPWNLLVNKVCSGPIYIIWYIII